MTSLIGNRRYLIGLGIVVVYAILNFTLNITVVGGSEFIYSLNTLLPALWGILALLLLARLYGRERGNAVASQVYRWLLVGLGLWVLGDIIWAWYDLYLQIEIPYPSWADLAWIVGYPFLAYALYSRVRSYGNPLRRGDIWLIGATTAVLLLIVAGFILTPILADYEPGRLSESFLNLAYPVFDTTVLALTLVVLVTLERGRFALPWGVITVAFVFNSIADLLFYRATWTGAYYPQGEATLLSVLIDGVYNLLYPCLCLGFYMVTDLLAGRAEVSERYAARRAPDLHKLSFCLFTDAENRIISFSENLLAWLQRKDGSRIIGARIDELLGIGAADLQEIEGGLQDDGYIRERPLSLVDPIGRHSETWLTGFRTRDPTGASSGANFVLQVRPDAVPDAAPLTRESAMLVESILERAGILEKEREEAQTQAMRYRFQSQMELLRDLVSVESGPRVARGMEAACQKLARDRGWPLRAGEGITLLASDAQIEVLDEAYPLMLSTARDYAARILGKELIDSELARLEAAISERPAVRAGR